jgi:hypothetical protein
MFLPNITYFPIKLNLYMEIFTFQYLLKVERQLYEHRSHSSYYYLLDLTKSFYMTVIKVGPWKKVAPFQMWLQNQDQTGKFLDIILFLAVQRYFFHCIYLACVLI